MLYDIENLLEAYAREQGTAKDTKLMLFKEARTQLVYIFNDSTDFHTKNRIDQVDAIFKMLIEELE